MIPFGRAMGGIWNTAKAIENYPYGGTGVETQVMIVFGCVHPRKRMDLSTLLLKHVVNPMAMAREEYLMKTFSKPIIF